MENPKKQMKFSLKKTLTLLLAFLPPYRPISNQEEVIFFF